MEEKNPKKDISNQIADIHQDAHCVKEYECMKKKVAIPDFYSEQDIHLLDQFIREMQDTDNIERVRDGAASFSIFIESKKANRVFLENEEFLSFFLSLLDLNDFIVTTYVCNAIAAFVYNNDQHMDVIISSNAFSKIMELIPMPCASSLLLYISKHSEEGNRILKSKNFAQNIFNLIPKFIFDKAVTLSNIEISNELFDELNSTQEVLSFLASILNAYANNEDCDHDLIISIMKLFIDNIESNVTFDTIIQSGFIGIFMQNYEAQIDKKAVHYALNLIIEIARYDNEERHGAIHVVQAGFFEFLQFMYKFPALIQDFIEIATEIVKKDASLIDETFKENFVIHDIFNCHIHDITALCEFVVALISSLNEEALNYSMCFEPMNILLRCLNSEDENLIEDTLKTIITALASSIELEVITNIKEIGDNEEFMEIIESLSSNQNTEISELANNILSILEES